jgi:hypothetical protein
MKKVYRESTDKPGVKVIIEERHEKTTEQREQCLYRARTHSKTLKLISQFLSATAGNVMSLIAATLCVRLSRCKRK